MQFKQPWTGPVARNSDERTYKKPHEQPTASGFLESEKALVKLQGYTYTITKFCRHPFQEVAYYQAIVIEYVHTRCNFCENNH